MLKKIPVEQLAVGMHLHELCGPWLAHPFWKNRFVIKDLVELQKICASDVTECWIDVEKGRDVNDPGAVLTAPLFTHGYFASPMPPSTKRDRRQPAGHAGTSTPHAPCGIQEEAGRAAALCRRSKEDVEHMFGDARMGRALDTGKCLPLVHDITASVWRNPDALISLARLKTHDSYSFMHSVAVCALMVSLARQMGHDENQAREAGMAGLLHDIGKAVMPLEVLNKKGSLTEDEYRLIQTHPERGAEILAEGHTPNEMAIDVARHHHERMDGAGYPDKLPGDDLSLLARMGSICDVYDAITSNRPYKGGWDPAESIARMSTWGESGQFDMAVMRAFVESIGIYPVGSLVRLQSGRLAVVAEQTPAAPLAPKVKVFFSTARNLPVAVELIDLATSGCHDAIVSRESNGEWKFPHLAEMLAGADLLRVSTKASAR